MKGRISIEVTNINDKELLNYIKDNDILLMETIRQQIEMKKRKELLEKHTNSIKLGNDGYWRTYVKDETRSKNRRQIKKKSRKDLEDELIAFYEHEQEEKPLTFKMVYENWVAFQRTEVVANTIKKYNADYKRFFEGTSFENYHIKEITEEDIRSFISSTVREKKLCKKTLKSLYGYIKGTIHSALVNRVISENPMEYITAKQFYKWCVEIPKSTEKRTVSDSDWNKLQAQIKEDHLNKPNYIPVYAIELARLTGMRVGELSALRWDSICSDYILIDKSEKYDREKKEYYIDKTKNGKDRLFPITKEIQKLLSEIKKIEIKYGYICDWVFANESGRIHARVISDCVRNKCMQVGITPVSIHALRRTANSKMRCNGVPVTVAASLLGHTVAVNESNYTYDITGIAKKRDYVEAMVLEK